MDLSNNNAVCFTGHRPSKLGGYDEQSDLILGVKRHLRRRIKQCIENGYTTFISGMAIGVDTWGAEIVLELKEEHSDLRLVCAVPFEGQEKKWPKASKERFKSIIEKSDYVHIVSEGSYTARKMQDRNEWMVDHSNVVVAVWDGTNGGTGNCVKYANKHKKFIFRIDPKGLV